MQQLLTTEKGQDPAPREIKDPTTAKMLKMFQIIVAEEVNLFNRITSKTIVFLRDWAPSTCSSTVTVSSSSRGSLTHIQIIFLYPSGHEKVNRKDKVFCTNCKRTEGQINAGGVSTTKLEKKKTSSINTYHDLSSQSSCSSGGNAGHPAIGRLLVWFSPGPFEWVAVTTVVKCFEHSINWKNWHWNVSSIYNVYGDKNGYFKWKHDLSLQLTKWFQCLNPTRS